MTATIIVAFGCVCVLLLMTVYFEAKARAAEEQLWQRETEGRKGQVKVKK